MSTANLDKREWPNKCPVCKSYIVWSLSSGRTGSKSTARCSNSIFNSVITNNLREIRICDWIGLAIRQRDGSVRIKNSDNTWLR